MRDNPKITKPQLAALLGVGKTTIDVGVALLKKKGLVERVGSNKTGSWKVIL